MRVGSTEYLVCSYGTEYSIRGTGALVLPIYSVPCMYEIKHVVLAAWPSFAFQMDCRNELEALM